MQDDFKKKLEDLQKSSSFSRNLSREFNKTREIRITPDFQKGPLASVLIETGDTKVICAVSNIETVPRFINTEGHGWLTAEYSLLPSSTGTRTNREASKGKISGRTAEIQRIIGRCIRSIVNLEKIGERTLYIDCDVIQADGGTRTAAITGGFTALVLALDRLMQSGKIINESIPIKDYLAAISVGKIESGEILLDLDYFEDSQAIVDLNVVRTGKGDYIEIQGGAEKEPFSRDELDIMLALADEGIDAINAKQKEIIGDILKDI